MVKMLTVEIFRDVINYLGSPKNCNLQTNEIVSWKIIKQSTNQSAKNKSTDNVQKYQKQPFQQIKNHFN